MLPGLRSLSEHSAQNILLPMKALEFGSLIINWWEVWAPNSSPRLPAWRWAGSRLASLWPEPALPAPGCAFEAHGVTVLGAIKYTLTAGDSPGWRAALRRRKKKSNLLIIHSN